MDTSHGVPNSPSHQSPVGGEFHGLSDDILLRIMSQADDTSLFLSSTHKPHFHAPLWRQPIPKISRRFAHFLEILLLIRVATEKRETSRMSEGFTEASASEGSLLRDLPRQRVTQDSTAASGKYFLVLLWLRSGTSLLPLLV